MTDTVRLSSTVHMHVQDGTNLLFPVQVVRIVDCKAFLKGIKVAIAFDTDWHVNHKWNHFLTLMYSSQRMR